MEKVETAYHTIDAPSFRSKLISWGQENFRSFPWRFTTEPYHILIAEVMLHRTQALQVVPVYTQFLEKYPTLALLTQAKQEELHEVLYSLGLRWRIGSMSSVV